jgi:hypothetical protein
MKEEEKNKVQHVVVKRVPGSNKRVMVGQTFTDQEFRDYTEMLNRWRVYVTRY